MADGGLTILDGAQLRAVDLTLPSPDGPVTGAQLLEFAESRVSGLLFGLALPENLKSTALRHLGIADDVSDFRCKELDRESASAFLQNYVSIVADELKGSCWLLKNRIYLFFSFSFEVIKIILYYSGYTAIWFSLFFCAKKN